MTNRQERHHRDSALDPAGGPQRSEQARGIERGSATISEAFPQALDALNAASHALPLCDRSAKLRVALSRLANASDKEAACSAARALVAESELALHEDPWFRFYRAATDAVSTVCEAS